MSEAPILRRPLLVRPTLAVDQVEPRVTAASSSDLRVAMVLEVLGGRTTESVAQEWDIEAQIVHRWVRDFLVAGAAAVTNRPDTEDARQRDRFLAAFAHELRSPVTVAKGWAMELAEEEVPPEEVADAVEHLNDALGRLSENIYDVELAASVSLGRVRVGIEQVNLPAICRTLPGRPEIAEGADLDVYADPMLMARILRDLWTTAHRDPAPASVSLEVAEVGTWTEIRVVRRGEPISPLVLKALFDPFGSNDDNTGVTLGLYLARALTVAHGGVLGAEGDDDITVLYTRIPRDLGGKS
ncbi:sensor histidine kinase [Nocardioides marmorisolisilvae]|uniref:histidine kinase n=1 Tax=Nocardioides marmorisolisilvae TaxID=1542737 RepID=A0A3N0DSE6_9ACTN|nr:HAMP domain-containing sensor histidine kinase [Nocardioides marmorisolisilvae]RNL78293.1 sensor histidine kinase [Nocardioides marmorisolisilvae]